MMFSIRVLPGVPLTLAMSVRRRRELISEDFPTFERPTIATSGAGWRGNCSRVVQLLRNWASRIFTRGTYPVQAEGVKWRLTPAVLIVTMAVLAFGAIVAWSL